MSSALEKSFTILELLARAPDGLAISQISQNVGIAISVVHRTLKELERLGYVRQDAAQSRYGLSIRLAALGLSYMAQTGFNDLVDPILERLAHQSGELVRLSFLEGNRLTWIAVAQGARHGLRYDPGQEQGVVVHFANTAAGWAYLATLEDDAITELVTSQGVAPPTPAMNSPTSLQQVLENVYATRDRGFAIASNTYIDGMTAIAIPIYKAGTKVSIGCVSVGGPVIRMTEDRIQHHVSFLRSASDDLSLAANGSRLFNFGTDQRDVPS